MPIDIGVAAIHRPNIYYTATLINKGNPANASGKITSVEIYASSNMTNAKVATFYQPDPTGYPNKLTARDSYSIGSVTSGAKRTFEVDLDVEAGDYLGVYFASGYIYYESAEGSGVWYAGYSDQTSCTNRSFNFVDVNEFSLYGTGLSYTKLGPSESISVGDSKQNTGEKQTSESFSVGDTKETSGNRLLSETISIADSIVKSGIKQLAETLSIADSFFGGLILKLNESLSIADGIAKNGIKSISESITVIDSKLTKMSKHLTESLSIADSFISAGKHLLSEAVSIADSKINKVYKQLTESISIADSAVRSGIKNIAEVVSIIDKSCRYYWGETSWNKIIKPSAYFTKIPKQNARWDKTEGRRSKDCN